MDSGRLESALRSIVSHRPSLTPDSVIVVTGGRIKIQEDPNVIFLTPREAERLTALPINTCMLLSTRVRSHRLGQHIVERATKQHIVVPQYILPAGMLKEVLSIILGWIRPKPRIAPMATRAAGMARLGSDAVQQQPLPMVAIVQPLRMITYREGRELFREFFAKQEVNGKSSIELAIDFAVVLEVGNYNMTDRDFRQLLCHYQRLAGWRPPHCDKSRRRNRQGNLFRLTFVRQPRW